MTALLVMMGGWPARRWWTAILLALATVLVVAVPTDLIDTPVFSREVPPTWWAWPTLLVVAALSGLIAASYVARPAGASGDMTGSRRTSRWGIAGSVLSFFAVGCPVCNKIVLIALGSSGAMRFFQPVQPVLAVASIAILAGALIVRLRREASCPVPQFSTSQPKG